MIINANSLQPFPIASNTVQCCVTSPPYWGLRDYGIAGQLGLESTPEEYVKNIVTVFREVWRVMRDDGTLWVNLGDSYAAADSGHNGYKDGRTNRAERHAAGVPVGIKPKNLVGIPWMVAFALRADGWYLRSDIIWAKPNPMPESVTDRPTKSHEYLFLLAKSEKYYFDQDAVAETSKTEAGLTWEERKTKGPGKNKDVSWRDDVNIAYAGTLGNGSTRNIRTVWTIATQPTSFAHFATYPEKLVEPCILAGSKAGDIILDPFSGSGTTGRVAHRLRREYVGLDLNMTYLTDIAPIRLTTQVQLFEVKS